MWKFLVKQQKIEVLEREVIADHQISFVNLKFTFDGDWKKFHKVVQFSQCDEIYSIVLGFDGSSCKLPAELHAGAVKMSVFGYDAESDTTVRAITVPITLNIRPSGFVGDDEDNPIPPTPDLYTQLLQKISEIQSGVNGKDGLSAYELAQKNGFVGTLAEWLESLKGAYGRDGKNGVDGRDGENGLSAYELAVQDGYTGTVEEWLQSITPDLSPYITRVEVLKIVDDKVHSSAPDLSPYVTRVETQKLVELKFQTVESDLTTLENTVNTEIQTVKDSTQYDQQNQNDTILNLENRIAILESQIASGNNAVTLFWAGGDVFEKYDNSLVFMVNNGTYPLTRFVEQYPDFCSENTDFSLNYSSAVFNWGVTVLSASCNFVNISPNSKVLLEYLAGANADSELCFVPPDGRSENTPIADFIFEKINNNDCRKVPFEWLYSANYITTLISCTDIPASKYYLAWTGVSDNTHPLVKRIQILG